MERDLILDNFRQEWQKELQKNSSSHRRSRDGSPIVHSSESQHEIVANASYSHHERKFGTELQTGAKVLDEVKPDILSKAVEYFERAVELEQSGCFYEAITFYRKSINLVPDIEFRVNSRHIRDKAEGSYHNSTNVSTNTSDSEDFVDGVDDLVSKIGTLLGPDPAICTVAFGNEVTNLSCLPPEILEKILAWVVGRDLDMRSLEKVSAVCRGFYLAARRPELWRRACYSIWGKHVGSPSQYGSWRDMYIKRHHPRYNGCYISHTSYFRSGESSFQDQNYQPWHMVRYFRCLRFFPEGLAHILTTADDLQSAVSILKPRKVRYPQVLTGHYRIHGSVLVLVFVCTSKKEKSGRLKGKKQTGGTTDVVETCFRMCYVLQELEVRPLKRYPNWQLHWCRYTIQSRYRNGKLITSPMDVTNTNNFPPLNFSRVKSYSAECDFPLM